jgi:hypothetical protein
MKRNKPPFLGLDYQGRHADIEQPLEPRWWRVLVWLMVGAACLSLLLILLGL